MIDDAAYQQGERVEDEIDALIDRAHAKRVESGEINLEQLWREHDLIRQRKRRRRNRARWVQHHLALSKLFVEAALEQKETAARLAAEGDDEASL